MADKKQTSRPERFCEVNDDAFEISKPSKKKSLFQKKVIFATKMAELSTLMVKKEIERKQILYQKSVAVGVYQKQFDKTESALLKALKPFFKDQIDSAVQSLQRLDSVSEGTIDQIFKPEEWNEDLINRVLPILAQAMAESSIAQYTILKKELKRKKEWVGRKASTASEWLDSLGGDQEYEELDDVEFITPYGSVSMGILTEFPAWMKSSIEDRLSETFSEPYWDEINTTTGGDINEVLRKGITDGWSIEDMAKEINKRFGDDYSVSRGRLIARTESGNALNGARSGVIDQLISDLGMADVIKKIWLSVLGNTTRDTHAHLDGVPADKDGCWALGGIRCRWPSDVKLPGGERCNCQCTIYTQFGMADDTADELIADAEIRQMNQGKMIMQRSSFMCYHNELSLSYEIKCGGEGGTMGPCPGPKKDPQGKYIPGAVGSLSKVDTSSWKKDDATAQWALKKLALMEEMVEKGKWNDLKAIGIPKSNYGKYSLAFDQAMENLSKQKSDKLEVLPAGAKPSKDPTIATDQGWKKVGGKLGTEEGGTYEMGGKKYYVKQPDDPDRARNENLALKLYGLAGASAKDANLLNIDGKLSLATEWVDSKKVDWNNPADRAKAQEDFAIHAWLNNRDAVGAGKENPMDNIQKKSDGSLIMLDAGGSLNYSGMGGSGKKPFDSSPQEWTTLRDEKKNPSMAKVFGDMTNLQLIASAKKLEWIKDSDIKDMVHKFGNGSPAEKDAMAKVLIDRKDGIVNVGKVIEKQISYKPPEVPTPPKPAVETKLEPMVELNLKSVKAAIPAPPQIMEGKTKDVPWYQNFQDKFNAIHAAAEKGDIEAVKAVKASETSTDTYTKKVVAYKNQVISALGAGGAVVKPVTTDQKIKDAFNTPKPAIKIDATEFPSVPTFMSSNSDAVSKNYANAGIVLTLAKAGDLAGLKALPTFASPKLQAYKVSLITEVASQLNPPPALRSISGDFASLAQHISGKPGAGVQKVGEWAVVGQLNGVKSGIPSGTWDHKPTELFSKGADAYAKAKDVEKNALESYTGSAYHSMNDSLRSGNPSKTALLASEALMKHSIPLPEGQLISRKHAAVDWSSVTPGTVVSDRAILSTSTYSEAWSGPSKLVLAIGPGVKGIPAKSFSNNPQENEILFAPNQRIMITHVEKKSEGHVVHGVILPTQDSQCCPP